MLRLNTLCLTLALSTAIAQAAHCAEISIGPALNGISPILIKGEIESGDARELEDTLRKQPRSLIILSSPGGELDEALRMGATIRTRGVATSVGDQCVSACALIWLSGARRYLNRGALVGFRAAYRERNGSTAESGMSNAEIGSFLTHLGLTREAIEFVTAAPPSDVRWLTRQDARRLRISIQNDEQGSQPPELRQPPAYQIHPVAKDTEKERLTQMATIASHLVVATECAKYFHVDVAKAKAMHAEVMKEGQSSPRFIGYVEDALRDRVHEIRRDGWPRVCAHQKTAFKELGDGTVYLP